MKEFHITVRVKNNLLYERRKAYGFTQLMMAKAIGIAFSTYANLENMKISPLDKDLLPKKGAQKVLNFFDVEFEDIWPESILKVKRAAITRTLSFGEIASIMETPDDKQLGADTIVYRQGVQDRVRSMLSRLTPRQEKVIRERFWKGRTYKEIAQVFEVTPGRIQQLEEAVLRKLHCPSRSGRLEDVTWKDKL